MSNPYRHDPYADPFEVFFHKYAGTPQEMCVAIGEGSPKYHRGYPVIECAEVRPGKVGLRVDVGVLEVFDRALFEVEEKMEEKPSKLPEPKKRIKEV